MSSTSLYGNVGNVTVSSKNLTTLYNATTGNTVVANVPDRNFTTLYAVNQTNINPTLPYGNANVEAFLNAGHDNGNTVQNINMSGSLTVGGESNLGQVSQVHIDGGTLNYVLSTDGAGGLSWVPQNGIGAAIPYIHFETSGDGIGQSFSDANLQFYNDVNEMNVMKNGVNIEPFYYSLSGTTLTINIWLSAGDTVDVLATGLGVRPGGNITEVQYNGGGGSLSGNASFTYNQVSGTLTVPIVNSSNIVTTDISTSNISVTNANIQTANIVTVNSNDIVTGNITVSTNANLGDVGNIQITGGSPGYVLSTDGAGDLSWIAQSGGGGNSTPGGSNSQVQFNNAGVFGGVSTLTTDGSNINVSNVANLKIPGGTLNQVLSTDGASNLSWKTVTSTAAGIDTQLQYNNMGTLAGTSLLTVYSGNLYVSNVNNLKVPGGSTGQTLTTYGNGTVYWGTSSNTATSLVAPIANVTITGGSNGQALTTYGNGTLYWNTFNQLDGVTNSTVIGLGNNLANFTIGNPSGPSIVIGNNNIANYSAISIGSNTVANSDGGISIGSRAGQGSTGSNNISIGYQAGQSLSGNYNITIGHQPTGTFYTGGNYNTIIGYDAQAPLLANNEIILGGSTTSNIRMRYGNVVMGNPPYEVTVTNGNVNATYFIGNGSFLTGITATNANYANYAGNAFSVTGSNVVGTVSTAATVTTNAQPNITSTGTLTSLTVSGNISTTGTTTIQQAKEKLVANATGATGTVAFDVLTSAIILQTANASNNFTLNIRGNNTTTFNSIVSTNESVSISYINKNGTTGYYANVIQIDGSTVTPVWFGGTSPTSGTASGYDMYNFNILKTGSGTYVVFAVVGGYQ
jgi:hypothetical protein